MRISDKLKPMVSLGPSMECLLRSGDILLLDELAKSEPGLVGVGDIIVFLGGSVRPEISAHRVWFKVGGGFITKGDANFWFDSPVRREQLLGRVVAVRRGTKVLSLEGFRAKVFGWLFAAASLFVKAAGLVLASCGRLALRLLARPARYGWAVGIGCRWQRFADAGNSLSAFASQQAGKIFEFFAEESSVPLPSIGQAYAGELRGEVQWEGRIEVRGDIFVPRGSALTIKAGSSVVFGLDKVYTRSFARAAEGGFQDFTDGRACRIFVEGVLNVLGAADRPVLVSGENFKGLVVCGRGKVFLSNAVLDKWGGPLSLFDRAECKVQSCSLSVGSTDGILAAGRSRADLSRFDCRGARRAFCAAEESSLSVFGAEASGCDMGICSSGRARVRASNFSLKDSRGGVEVADASVVRISCSTFSGQRTCVSAYGGAVVALNRARISGASECGVSARGAKVSLSSTVLENCAAGARAERSELRLRSAHVSDSKSCSLELTGGRLLLTGTRIERSGAGAVALGGRAAAVLRDCVLTASKAEAVLARAGTRLALENTLLEGNGSGVALSRAAAEIRGCRFLKSARGHLSLDGARALLRSSVLEDCAQAVGCHNGSGLHVEKVVISRCSDMAVILSGASSLTGAGLDMEGCASSALNLFGSSSAELEEFSAKACAEGLVLQEKSRALLKGGAIEGCSRRGVLAASGSQLRVNGFGVKSAPVGILCESGAAVRAQGLSFEGCSSEALWLRGGSDFEGRDLRFFGCAFRSVLVQEASSLRAVDFNARTQRVALWLESAARAYLSGGRMEDCSDRGFFADGGSFVSLFGVVISGCGSQAGRSQGGSRAELLGCRVDSCRIGFSADGGSSLLRGGILANCADLCLSYSGGEHEADGAKLSASGTGVGLYGQALLRVGELEADDCRTGAHICGASLLSGDAYNSRDCSVGLYAESEGEAVLGGVSAAGARVCGVRLSGGAALKAGVAAVTDCSKGIECSGGAEFFCGRAELLNNGTALSLVEFSRAVCQAGRVEGSSSRGAEAGPGCYLELRGVFIDRNSGQGLHADGALTLLDGCDFCGNDIGVSVSGGELRTSGSCGFKDNKRIGLSLSGGTHKLESAEFSGTGIGLGLYNGAQADVAFVSAEGSSDGLHCCAASRMLCGSALLRHCRVGLSAEDGAQAEFGKLEASECVSAGIRAFSSAGVKVSELRAVGCFCGVSCEGKGLVRAFNAELAGNKIGALVVGGAEFSAEAGVVSANSERGVSSDGGSVSLSNVRLLSNAGQSVFAQGGARLEMSWCVLEGGTVGVSLQDSDSKMADCSFKSCSQAAASFRGGRHELAQIVLEGVPLGLGFYDGAAAELSGFGSVSCAEAVRACASRLHGKDWHVRGGLALCVEHGSEADLSGLRLTPDGEHAVLGRGKAVLRLNGLSVSGAAAAAVALENGSRCLVRGGEVSDCGRAAKVRDSELECSACVFRGLGAEAFHVAGGKLHADMCGFEGGAASLVEGSDYISSGCSYAGAYVALRANGGSSIDSSHDVFRNCGCAVGAEDASIVLIVGGEFAGMKDCALRLDGKSSAKTENCRFEGNRSSIVLEDGSELDSRADEFLSSGTGLRLNNGARAALTGAKLRQHSFACVHLTGARLNASSSVFAANVMGVFADCSSGVKLENCEFYRNRTGVKADNASEVSCSGSSFVKSSWDAVWCAGGAKADALGCLFRDNRYGIKEDGPCRTRIEHSRFEGRHQAGHLRYPR